MAFLHGIDQGLFGIAMSQRHLASDPDQDDCAFLLGPLQFSGKAGKKVVNGYNLAVGKFTNVFLGHCLAGETFGIDFTQFLPFGKNEDIAPEAFHGFTHAVLVGFHFS